VPAKPRPAVGDVVDTLPVEHLFTMHAMLAAPVVLPGGPYGTRVLISVTGGTVKGERIAGELLAGGDWVTMRADGVGRLDVRLTIRTDDDAVVYMAYAGLIGADRIARVAPLFETGDERYAWLNDIQAIALGSPAPGEVTYEVYALR
jgi:phage terminase large subunit-like protein